jgi:glutaredoxin-related protein
MQENKEYIEPAANNYTIYTKSGCPNCTKVKKFLESENEKPLIIDCDEWLIEDKPAFLEFIREKAGKECKTFPMVFCNGEFIGGFDETRIYKEKQDAFLNTEF